MDLSIVVVSYNVERLLIQCLASACDSLSDGALAYEIVVVDNASSDGSVRAVRTRFPEARLIVNDSNRGFAAGNNQALREARGRLVLLLNPDTEPRSAAIRTLAAFLDEHPRIAMAGPRLVYGDGSFQHSAFRFPTLAQTFLDLFPLHHRLIDSRCNGRYPRSWYQSGKPFEVDHPLGACMMVRREVLDGVGMLDEGFFMYCEEIDWALRIRQAGWAISCVPEAVVVHHVAQSTQQFRDEMFVALWRSRFRLFAKHYGRAYNWAARRIVQLGLRGKTRQARREGQAGTLDEGELRSRLAAYRRVRELSNG